MISTHDELTITVRIDNRLMDFIKNKSLPVSLRHTDYLKMQIYLALKDGPYILNAATSAYMKNQGEREKKDIHSVQVRLKMEPTLFFMLTNASVTLAEADGYYLDDYQDDKKTWNKIINKYTKTIITSVILDCKK